jgi:transmembrane sensor
MDAISPGEDVLEEAERWFVRLMDGNCSADERAAFVQWRATPAHAAAYAATERLWRRMGDLAGNPELERLAAEARAATAPRQRARDRRPRWRLPAAMAACTVLAVAAMLLVFRLTSPPPVVYATGPAQRHTVKLHDGSRVTLNIDTELAVRIHGNVRELTLRHGEALFDVAHDAQRPFRVSAGGGRVTALGTHFQVSNRDREVVVTLLQGSVAVDRDASDEHLRLRPGQQAAFAVGSGRIATRTVDTDVISSWARGRLLFRATPLADVIAEVNRYAATPLRLADPSLAETPVSGTFPIGDSRSVALGLQALLPLQADTGTPGWITLRRR